MAKVHRILLHVFVSKFVRILLAMLGGFTSAVIVWELTKSEFSYFLAGVIALIVFVFASVPAGMKFTRNLIEKNVPVSNEFWLVVLACALMITGSVVIWALNMGGPLQFYFGISCLCVLVVINFIAGASLQVEDTFAGKHWPLRKQVSYERAIKYVAMFISILIPICLLVLASVYVIRMAPAQIPALINIMLIVVAVIALFIPFGIVYAQRPQTA